MRFPVRRPGVADSDVDHRTARALRSLEGRGWRILHDRSIPGSRTARLDHLTIGPAGVFHLAVWRRTVSGAAVRDGRPRVDGEPQIRALRTLAWETGVVAVALGVPVRALAVVDELPGPGAPGGVLQREEVTVVPLWMLRRYLRGLLPVPGMDVHRVRELAERATAALPPYPG